MIITLVMSRMDKILWIDKKNMLVCAGPGIRGDLFEKTLEKEGVILGHEPDSAEFSTVGGWISTRCSGMRKNTYGNIEGLF